MANPDPASAPDPRRQLRHSAPGVRQALAVAHQRPRVREHTYAQRTGWAPLPCVYPGTGCHASFCARDQRAPTRLEGP